MKSLLSVAVLAAAPLFAQQVPSGPPPTPVDVQLNRLQSKYDDFGGLSRYAAENAKLGPAGKGVRRVVFFGDSITDNWGRMKDAGVFFPGKPYVNRGISGQTTPQMLIRFRQDVIDLHPAAVVILAGTNDIAQNTGPESSETIHNNFRSMVAGEGGPHPGGAGLGSAGGPVPLASGTRPGTAYS